MTESSSSDSESSSNTGDSSNSSSTSLSDQNRTIIIKTLRVNRKLEQSRSEPGNTLELDQSPRSPKPEELAEMRGDENVGRPPPLEGGGAAGTYTRQQVTGNGSTTSGSTSSSYKRYKFGLTNHFLTMPDAADQPKSVRAYQKELAYANQSHQNNNNNNHQHHEKQAASTNEAQQNRKERRRKTPMNTGTRTSKERHLRVVNSGDLRQESHPLGSDMGRPLGPTPDDRLAAESDDNCDLSVLAASLHDANSLLSDDDNEEAGGGWPSPRTEPYNAAETRSNLNFTQSSDGDSSSKPLTKKANASDPSVAPIKTMGPRPHRDRADLLPAGDAGLDAVQCNSKARNVDDDYYLSPGAYLNSPIELTTASKFSQHGVESLQNKPHLNLNMNHHLNHHHQDDPDDPLHQHHMKKKRKLNGDSEDCASNGLLVKFSSIMYATFLVILGCILHVSELKQKSRNSSDHIYTTIVASIGILWLIFLQTDLQRYKKYASKFILLETIFNDHHNQGKHRRGGLGSANDVLMGLDPTSRSTSSSSASLVNDRMSMNTEVIFKKTAYKMYQHHAATSKPYGGSGAMASSSSPSSRSPSVLGEPFEAGGHHHHQPHHDSNGLSTARTPQLVPAYKFLHGKMGANFYLKCGMAAFCFGHVIHEGLRFGQQVYFFATNNVACRDSAALVAHLVTPLYSFYQLFMMFKYSNLVINRHKILARFGLMHIIGTCVTFWFRTILEEAFEDFVHKMDYFKSQNKPINHYLDPTQSLKRSDPHHSVIIVEGNGTDERAPGGGGLLDWLNSIAVSESSASPFANQSLVNLTNQANLFRAEQAASSQASPTLLQPLSGQNLTLAQSALLALMSSPLSATITPQIVRHLPDSYHCAQNTLLTTKSMNALPYLYPFTIEYNLLIAATFLSLYFNIGKVGAAAKGLRCYLACCRPSGGINSGAPSELPAVVASKQPSSSGTSFIGSHPATMVDLMSDHGGVGGFPAMRHQQHHSTGSLKHHHHHHQLEHHLNQQAGEYKSNFVVQADCHAANKGLFLGFFVLLVTLVTIVIFFVTINKPSHLQLGIKINLIQEATLTGLILVVTLAGYRQIMRLTRNPFIKDKVTTDDVLMLIPLPFFFIHSLLSFRAETATLYSAHHQLSASHHHLLGPPHHQKDAPTLNAAETAARVLKLETAANQTAASLEAAASVNANANPPSRRGGGGGGQGDHQRRPLPTARTDFLLTMPSGLESSRASSSSRLQKLQSPNNNVNNTGTTSPTPTTTDRRPNATSAKIIATTTTSPQSKIDHFKLLTIVLNLAVMVEVLVQTNFIIDGLRRCSESRYLRFKKPGRELITFAILLNITYWIVATFETKSVEQYKTEIDYYGPLPYMFISHTTLPVMLFYRYHSSVCLAEIWNRAYKPPKRR